MPAGPFCAEALDRGFCSKAHCQYRHDVYYCDKCQIVVLPFQWRDHLQSEGHRNTPPTRRRQIPFPRAQGASGSNQRRRPERHVQFNPPLMNPAAFREHRTNPNQQDAVNSQRRVGMSRVPPSRGSEQQRTSVTRCELCCEDVPGDSSGIHEQTRQHLQRKRAADLEQSLKAVQKDRLGVAISTHGEPIPSDEAREGSEIGVNFGVIQPTPGRNETTLKITITKTADAGPGCCIQLTGHRFSSHIRNDHSENSFSVVLVGHEKTIRRQRPRQLEVTCKPGYTGIHRAFLELRFSSTGGGGEPKTFAIVRTLYAMVGVADDLEHLKCSAPFEGLPLLPYSTTEDIHPGRVMVKRTKPHRKRHLPEFKAPKELIDHAFPLSGRSPYWNIVNNFMPLFHEATYGEYFQVLLFIEEEQNRRDLSRFDQENVQLELHGSHYRLKVEGLAEKRPSVMIGDVILVQRHDDPRDSTWYQGVVHELYEAHVQLRFHSAFGTVLGAKFNVKFTLNRLPYRRYHEAITGVSTRKNPCLQRLIFPNNQASQAPISSSPPDFSLFNRLIASNGQQKHVVQTLISRPLGSAPFLIWGPPGTGKTVTVVETIRQLLHQNPKYRILACAPSNAAADLIAERLLGLGSALFRLCSASRGVGQLPPKLEDNVLIRENNFVVPRLEELEKYRVVVSTCVAASNLHGTGLPCGHFNYIFLDEAGQAHEPESMVAITGMADTYTNVVLSGDPKQLPPILRSSLAKRLGLEKTYLDRMTERMGDKSSGVTQFFLKDHYRSHVDIIRFPNGEFYEGKLRPCADPVVTQSLLRFNKLPKKDFPIIFHSISGKDEREEKSPSFFNAAEAAEVKKYVAALLDDKRFRLTADHIGIISPYNKQCAKIRSALRSIPKASMIKVGSVEEFQGQERRVIIISTVRSNLAWVDFDLRHNLGFVADKRRFNVAVTRSQALLIVIGDPVILSLNDIWRKFLNYIFLRGGWVGKQLDWNPKESVELSNYDVQRSGVGRVTYADLLERAKDAVAEHLQGDNSERPNLEDDGTSYEDQPFREID